MKSFIGGRFGLVLNRDVVTATQNSFAHSLLFLKFSNSLPKPFFKANTTMLYLLLSNYLLHTTPTPLSKNPVVSANFSALLQSDFFVKYTLFQIRTAKAVIKYSIRNTESELKKKYFYIFRRFHYVWEKYLFLPTRELECDETNSDESAAITEGVVKQPFDLNSILTRIVEYRINLGIRLAKKFKWTQRFKFRRLKIRRIKYFGSNIKYVRYDLVQLYRNEDFDYDPSLCKANFRLSPLQPFVVYEFCKIPNKPDTLIQRYKPFRLFYKNTSKKEFNTTQVRKKYHAYYLHKTFEYTYNKYWVNSVYDLVLNWYFVLSERELPYFLKNRKTPKLKHFSLHKWYACFAPLRAEVVKFEQERLEALLNPVEVEEVKNDNFELELPNFFADPVAEFIINSGDFFERVGEQIALRKETSHTAAQPPTTTPNPHAHFFLKTFETFSWDVSDDTLAHIDDILFYDFVEIGVSCAFGFTSIFYDHYNYRYNIWICMIKLDPIAYRQGRLRFPRTAQEIYDDFWLQWSLRLTWEDFFLPKVSRENVSFKIFYPQTPKLRVISKRRAKQTKKRSYKQRYLTPAKKQKKILNKFVKFFFANKFEESSVWFFKQFYDTQLYPFRTRNFWYNIFIDEMLGDVNALNDHTAVVDTLRTSNVASQKYLKLWALSNFNPVVLTPHRFRQVMYDKFHKTSARVDSKYLQFYLNNFISYWAGMRSFVIFQSNLSLKNQNFSNTLFNTAYYLLDYFSKIHVKFFKKFPIESFVEFFTFSMFKKDLNYFVEFFKFFVEETHLKEHKKVFSSFEFMLKKFLYKVMVWTHVQGIKFEVSGKISVTGNAKKRRKIIKIGYYSLTHKKLKIDYLLDTIRTPTGVLGFRTFITY